MAERVFAAGHGDGELGGKPGFQALRQSSDDAHAGGGPEGLDEPQGVLGLWDDGGDMVDRRISSEGAPEGRGIQCSAQVLVANGGHAGAGESAACDGIEEGGDAASALEELVAQSEGQPSRVRWGR